MPSYALSRPGSTPSWRCLLGRLITLSQVAFTKFVESDAEDKIQRLTSEVVFDISMSGLAIYHKSRI